MDLKDKVAVITGGASGLGRATVKRFVANGAKAAIFDMNEEKGQQLVDELGGSVIFCNVNVTSEESVQAGIAATMEAFGGIHICCNFAGTGNGIRTMGKKGPFPLDEFNKIIQINLVGSFNVLRLCAEKMADNEVLNDDGGRGVGAHSRGARRASHLFKSCTADSACALTSASAVMSCARPSIPYSTCMFVCR